jgi:hypothetical protein
VPDVLDERPRVAVDRIDGQHELGSGRRDEAVTVVERQAAAC